ncbi:MAG: serine hydrolase [Alphaproteobacteria bacterium PA4]|nr:MAG: serine hydrolase [Alphaproteobacteria bacterium PA4]
MAMSHASGFWAGLAMMALVAAPVRAITIAVPPPGVITPAAKAAADALFTDPRTAETRAVVVLLDGKPVYERYAPGYGPGNRFISWSMAKSLTSTIIGALVADGRLELDSPAPVPAWRVTPGDPRAAITLRQLLHMSSGLKHIEAEPVELADTNRALFSDKSGDIVAHAVAAPLESKPGTRFQYSTLTTHILDDIAVRTLAPAAKTPAQRRAAMRRFLLDRIAGPAGMASLLCEYDPAGTLLGGSLCHASARDWASFGQMYLDGGKVAGRQVVAADWVKFVRTPAPTNPGYGGQFWLNRPGYVGKDTALFADQGPVDAYAAVGHLGQYVIVVPSKRLVVVRLGKTQDDVLKPVKVALGRLVNSIPAVAVP